MFGQTDVEKKTSFCQEKKNEIYMDRQMARQETMEMRVRWRDRQT